MITFAFEKEEEQLLFQRWISLPEWQCNLSFAEFKAGFRSHPQKPDAVILADVKQILESFPGGEKDNGNI